MKARDRVSDTNREEILSVHHLRAGAARVGLDPHQVILNQPQLHVLLGHVRGHVTDEAREDVARHRDERGSNILTPTQARPDRHTRVRTNRQRDRGNK